MPMFFDPVTNGRSEPILFGIAAQIQGGMAEVKSEVIGLITEAELRWQAQLASQLVEHGAADATTSLNDFREQLTQCQAQVDSKLRAQDAELQQLEQGLKDL